MKKLLAVILSVLCLFSCLAPAASAAGTGVLGELASTFFEGLLGVEMEEDTSIGYGVIYDVDSLSGVSVVYKPSPSISFENPGIYTITSDTPLSIDYEFICWEDNNGNRYYAGDKIYVDGTITLTAVWLEKTDGGVRIARIIKTTFEAFRRLIGKFFGILDIIENFEPALSEPGVYDLTLNEIYYVDADFEGVEGDERVLLYIDSKNFAYTELKRVDELKEESQLNTGVITFCTGWNIETKEPENYAEYEGLTYSFEALKGPKEEDVLMLCTGNLVSEYVKNLEDGQKFYMTVTVNDSLYSSSKEETGFDFNESCNPVSVVFTLVK